MVTQLNLFQGEEHKPFSWSGGQPAALLIHGFPGTPAELRSLGKSLHRAGWTVEGLLLPGFGADIETLFERQASEWITAVEQALVKLKSQHSPVLLIGYSMGAALSIQAATSCPPAAMVLLAPFWQEIIWWQKLMGFVLKPFFRQIRPFKKADFTDPKVRRGMSNLLSSVDIDDPDVQRALQDLTVPASMFERLFSVGQAAYRLAPEIALPTMVVQGVEDEVVSVDKTRRLLQRLAGPLQYVEVNAGHDLVNSDQPSWSQVEGAVLAFAQNSLPDGNTAPEIYGS